MGPPSAARAASIQRFRRIGLAGNPFRVAGREELARLFFPWEGGPHPADVARGEPRAIQVIGPRGSGKSTFIAALVDALRERGARARLDYLPPGTRPSIRPPGPGEDWWLIDEAQRLTAGERRLVKGWAAAPGRRVGVTSHEDLSGALGITGGLRTFLIPPAGAARIRRFFEARLRFAGGDPSRLPLREDAAAGLAARAGGSLRRAEEILYEAFEAAAAEGATEITPEILRIADGLPLDGAGARFHHGPT